MGKMYIWMLKKTPKRSYATNLLSWLFNAVSCFELEFRR